MTFTIGIDVGGTNTDGVLYCAQKKSIEKSVKIPTSHNDYVICIGEALRALSKGSDIKAVASLNISTTLATNMLLEKKGSPVNLILIGCNNLPHIKKEIFGVVSPSSVIEIRGGHTRWGKEREPFDARALRSYAEAHKGELFAASALFSPRNPEHELAAAQIIKEIGCAGVTCGHELARLKLNAVKRAVTAFLNSSLIPVTERLIYSVEKCAEAVGLECPIMFLRSDGSLISGRWCARFPVETIFSGPAASMRGGAALGGVEGGGDAVVVEMGGTSTDIGSICGGRAVYSSEGAVIGDYKTMIPSLRIRSAALGGDSAVCVRQDGGLSIGPARVPPIFSSAPDSGYTPSDALCTLGLYKHSGADASAEASERYGSCLKLGPKEFAALVKSEVSSRLKSLICDADDRTAKIICVGAPVAAFIADDGRCAVPHEAPIASAVGAAVSSLALCCTASILHNFEDEVFYAFLPATTFKEENFVKIAGMARDALVSHIKQQAALMGFGNVNVRISYENERIGNDSDALVAMFITAEAIVHPAQE